jgi:ribosomal protein S12 methylthiotransferase accessory factor YcaO
MDTTMAEWTRDELEALHPDGTVNVQVDDDVRPMTTDEWSAWIDQQVGQEKPVDGEGAI